MSTDSVGGRRPFCFCYTPRREALAPDSLFARTVFHFGGGVSLKEQRLSAAEASGGFSNDLIYARIQQLVREKNLGGSVLDYGAGVGIFTRHLAGLSCFTKVGGADILPRPANLPSSIAWFALDLNDPLPVEDGCFDVIIAAEVIEHLENPRKTAREFFRTLRPGGTLLLSTPNNESWRSLLSLAIRGHFVAFLESSYPAHITALVRRDLYRILTEAGFAPVAFAFTNVGGLPKLPSVTWQAISSGVLRGVRYSDNVIAIATKR